MSDNSLTLEMSSSLRSYKVSPIENKMREPIKDGFGIFSGCL